MYMYFLINILAVRGEPTENKSIIDKNIMPLCFSHMFYLFLGIEVARETKQQSGSHCNNVMS